MKAILFRKLVIEGNNYYQLYKSVDNFNVSDDFADFENRKTKNYFYIEEKDLDKIPEPSMYNIYTDKDDKIETIADSNEFFRIFMEFKKAFKINVREIKTVDEIVDEVSKKILFQKDAIYSLVEQILLNQSIMLSELPRELKVKLKNNILFHGLYGSGKKTIIEELEKNIDIPYADVTISSSLKDTLEEIINQLLERSNSNEEASTGIVFIRDNFKELANVFNDKVFNTVNFINSQDVLTYGDNKIDFKTLTFVVLFDEYPDISLDDEDIYEVQNMTDCLFRISTKVLTNREKFYILKSENGRIRQYEKFLNSYDKKLIVDDSSLRKIIKSCSKVDPGMNILNSVIDGIVKTSLLNGLDDVVIDENSVKDFVPALTVVSDKYIKEDFTEKKQKIINDSLKEIYEKVIENVIGQDKEVKRILYTILENRRMANKKDLANPKQYIQKMLIRGESGGGKTLILDTIANILNIPIFTADATQYTEEGYVGSSVTDMLVSLYHAANDDLSEAEKGILVIDEIDKKANNSNEGGPSRGAVLDSLLKIIEGAVIPINVGTRTNEEEVMFDTSRLTVICSGAFENIEYYRDLRLGKRKVGFANNDNKDVDKTITDEDYVAFGMKRQFMSRLSVIVNLNKNTKESLINIMKKSKSSALEIEKFKLEDKGIEIEYTEDFYEKLAIDALRMKIGARGIKKALERVLTNIHIEDIDANEVKKIIFTGDVIEDPNKIILVTKEKQKKLEIK